MKCQGFMALNYTISSEKLESLGGYYRPATGGLRWPVVFTLPGFMEAWWRVFGAAFEPLVLVARAGDNIVGIAPLKLKDGVASFIGDNSVCDYLDIVTVPGTEEDFSRALLDHLSILGIRSMVLETLRPDAAALKYLASEGRRRGHVITCSRIDVSFEMPLPATWEDYLHALESKQRRDVERKIRQLETVAGLRFRVLRDTDVGRAELDMFLGMMGDSRRDKARFLTAEMRSYFGRIAAAATGYGILRLGVLEMGVALVAAILYFEYNDRIYLYNSGYMPQYAEMNVGLVSKLYCIRQAIADQRSLFDFLKGPEVYKSRLGGHEVGLSRCVFNLG
jgi:CelD/BcsL family acetyltransferase involved in cellulose biosynthesis